MWIPLVHVSHQILHPPDPAQPEAVPHLLDGIAVGRRYAVEEVRIGKVGRERERERQEVRQEEEEGGSLGESWRRGSREQGVEEEDV